MAAAPRKNVIRETSDPGDVIILMGGRTIGRDGIGGATGSSRYIPRSPSRSAAEVQKAMHRPSVNYRDCSAAQRSAV